MIERDIDLLDIDLMQMKKDIVRECQLDDVLFDCNIDDMKVLLNEAIEIETQEEENKGHRERGIVKKRNGAGMFVSIKNVHISLKIILEAFALKGDVKPLAVAVFLYNLFSQLCVEINRWQMSVYIILYEEGRKVAITDDNLMEIVQHRIKEYGYEKKDSQEIMDTVNELYNIGMIIIEDGFYKAGEKIYL